MTVKVDNKGIIQHYADAFDERGENFALGATTGTPIAMRKGIPAASLKFYEAVAQISAPTVEYKFEGDFTNTGTLSVSRNSSGMTSAADTSVAGLTGKISWTAANSYLEISADASNLNFSTDRSFIYVCEPGAGSVAGTFLIYYDTDHMAAVPSHLRNISGPRVQSTTTFPYLDSSHANSAHTVEAAAQGLNHLDSGDVWVLVFSYDLSGKDVTVRWKQQSHPASGHSFLTLDTGAARNPDTTSGTKGMNIFGRPGISQNWVPYICRYFAIIDSQVGADNFDAITATIGM